MDVHSPPTMDLVDLISPVRRLCQKCGLYKPRDVFATAHSWCEACYDELRAARSMPQEPMRRSDSGGVAKRRRAWGGYGAVIERDPCAYCGEPFGAVDHLIPRSRGGDDTWENIASACRSCNSKKGTRKPLQFLLTLRLRVVLDPLLDQEWLLSDPRGDGRPRKPGLRTSASIRRGIAPSKS